MTRIPQLLRNALTTRVAGHVIELNPVARGICVRAPDGTEDRHSIDFYDGFHTPVILDGEDRSLEVIRAVGLLLESAYGVAVDYELAGYAALHRGDEMGARFDLAYVKAAEAMRAVADGLRNLESWHCFQVGVAERLAQRAAAAQEVSQ